ncbi:cysteine--tRNA ligase, partial [Rothia nasimurium]
PLVVRYYLGQAHYRSVLDYHPTSLEEARVAVERVEAFLSATRDYHREDVAVPEAFAEAMDDDLNIPKALAALHAGVRAGNAALAAGESAQGAAEQVYAMAKVLGLAELMSFSQAGATATEPGEHAALDSLIQIMLTQRAEAREAKDWARADQIRDALAAAGITVKDGATGSTWSL